MRWTLLSIVVAIAGCALQPGDGAADTGARTVETADAGSVGDSSGTSDAADPGLADAEARPPTYATVRNIFRTSCGGYCHAGGSTVGASLVLAPADGTEPALVARRSREVPRLMLIAPGDPGASYLMIKVDGTMASQPECSADARVCGFPMPYSYYARASLSEAERAAIRGWIAAGAPGLPSP